MSDKEYNKKRFDRKNAYKKKEQNRKKRIKKEYDDGFSGNY